LTIFKRPPGCSLPVTIEMWSNADEGTNDRKER
jgi:hypothetical protein